MSGRSPPASLATFFLVGLRGTRWIVLDEVQRIPELSNEVRALIEADHRSRSPARVLASSQRGHAHLLAGSAILSKT